MRREFTSESDLVSYIRRNTRSIFGEAIQWQDDMRKLPGDRAAGTWIYADLVGKDTNNKTVIAEVKLLRPTSERKYDLAREAVGQVLHYAHAYVYYQVNTNQRPRGSNPFVIIHPSTKQFRVQLHNTRLFVVSEDASQPVQDICQVLSAYDINIEHLYVNR